MIVSAYCLIGRTAMGTYTKRGTIAVDPKVIKLGSHLYVPGYGNGRALDTGSAIHGRRIDIWMKSCDAARKWGIRKVRVKIR